LLALNDAIAVGCLRGLLDAGVRVPRDLSLAGFNNQDFGSMTTPTLTTIDQNIEATITAAAEMILAQLAAPPRAKPLIHMVQPELIVRESTGPARV
jgi:DNA-binding LacI/PurR family transcriptional regulator